MSVRYYDDFGDRLIRQSEVIEKIGFGRKWIWERTKTGAFPKAKNIDGAKRWSLREIDEWIRNLP